MKFIDVINSRTSIRRYSSQEVPNHIIEQIVDCGRKAPSGQNHQERYFLVVNNREILGALADDYRELSSLHTAKALICLFVKYNSTRSPIEDGSAALENMLLACTNLGLGACWLWGGSKLVESKVRIYTGAPKDYQFIGMMTLGYPEKEQLPIQKRPLEEILMWNRWGNFDGN